MSKPAHWLMLLPVLALTAPAQAILLDCKHNADDTYLCVEIEGSQAIQPAPTRAPEIDKAHIEQAKKECVYREPRVRMGSGSAVRAEARKSAQKDYDRCVASRAWELKNLDARSGGN